MTKELAPRGGFEPPTFRLTAECSTVELPGNWTAISNHFNTLRCGLLHGNHAWFGPIGPNFETQTDFLTPLALVLNVILQPFCALVRDILIRVSDPVLSQVPRHTGFSQLRC